jgi:hypothetical protein
MATMDKKEQVNKSLTIVAKVAHADGSWIGAGFIQDPEFKDKDIGVVVCDQSGRQVLGFEMNMQNLLILVQVITIAVRMYIEKKAGGIFHP